MLDAVAIAAQSLVGAALGGGRRAAGARPSPARSTGYGLVLGCGFGVLFAALAGVLPRVFTDGRRGARGGAGGVVVLRRDAAGRRGGVRPRRRAARRRATPRTCAPRPSLAAVARVPAADWASLAFGWGLVGIWSGLTAFVLMRLAAVLLRVRSGRWAVTGAVRA